jgi:hypothetical protein
MAAVSDDAGPLVAVMGLTTIQLINVWQSVAPTMKEVREAAPGDPAIAQRLMDADLLGAGLAVMIGGTTSLLIKSWLPILMALGSVTLFAYWHRQVHQSDNWMMGNDDGQRPAGR